MRGGGGGEAGPAVLGDVPGLSACDLGGLLSWLDNGQTGALATSVIRGVWVQSPAQVVKGRSLAVARGPCLRPTEPHTSSLQAPRHHPCSASPALSAWPVPARMQGTLDSGAASNPGLHLESFAQTLNCRLGAAAIQMCCWPLHLRQTHPLCSTPQNPDRGSCVPSCPGLRALLGPPPPCPSPPWLETSPVRWQPGQLLDGPSPLSPSLSPGHLHCVLILSPAPPSVHLSLDQTSHRHLDSVLTLQTSKQFTAALHPHRDVLSV